MGKAYGKSKATRAIILFVNNLSRTGLNPTFSLDYNDIANFNSAFY